MTYFISTTTNTTWEYFSPFLSFLHLSQLYMLSPFSSSAEKK